MKLKLTHFSYSCLDLWYKCKWCWYQKYVKKTPQPINQYMQEGSLYHKHVHNYHTGLNYDADLIKVYTDSIDISYRKQSEIKFLSPFVFEDFQAPINCFGFLDGVNDNGIVDLKYGSSRPAKKKNIQGILYSTLLIQPDGEYPLFTFNWVNKSKQELKNIEVQYTKDDSRWLVDEIMIPFFKDLENIDKIDFDFMKIKYFGHQYPNCPFC